MPVNFAYLMQQLSCGLENIRDDVLDSFTALMPEPLSLDLMRKYLVRQYCGAHTLTPRMVRAMATWSEQEFKLGLLLRLKCIG